MDVAATVHTLPDEDAAGDEAFGERPRGRRRGVRSHEGRIVREGHGVVPSPGRLLLVAGDQAAGVQVPTKGAMDAESASSADAADDWAVENGYEAVAVIASGGDDDEALELRGDEQDEAGARGD